MDDESTKWPEWKRMKVAMILNTWMYNTGIFEHIDYEKSEQKCIDRMGICRDSLRINMYQRHTRHRTSAKSDELKGEGFDKFCPCEQETCQACKKDEYERNEDHEGYFIESEDLANGMGYSLYLWDFLRRKREYLFLRLLWNSRTFRYGELVWVCLVNELTLEPLLAQSSLHSRNQISPLSKDLLIITSQTSHLVHRWPHRGLYAWPFHPYFFRWRRAYSYCHLFGLLWCQAPSSCVHQYVGE